MKRLLFCWLLLPFAAAAQVQSCNWNQTVTGSGVGTSQPNDTVSPNCNAFALTWTSTGFTALTIQLEGSHVSGSGFTAFSGTSTVVAGTSNPTSALSGVIIIQAQTKIAFIRFNVPSVTGSGSIQTQLKGYSGISAAASAAQAGSGTSWANITPGTNNKGFFQCQAPCVIEPTAIGGGGIYGTQIVDANDLPALTISTPGGPAIDFLNVATSVGGGGATVTVRAIGADSNVNLDVLAKGVALVHLGSNLAFVDNAGNLTIAGVNGAVVPTSAAALATNSSKQLIAASLSTLSASTKLMSSQTGAFTNGDCLMVLNGNATDFGQACGNMRNSITNTGIASFAIDASASTVANAIKVPVQASVTASANGAVGYDSTTNNWLFGQNAVGAIGALFSSSPSGGKCLQSVVSSGQVNIVETAGTCGTGSGTVTGVTATAPLTASAGATPNISATYQGTSPTKVQGAIGTTTSGAYPKYDATGNLVDSGIAAGNATNVNGAAVPASATVLGSNASNQLVAASLQGNGTKAQLSTGVTTTNNCVKYDANGNTVDAGAPCGTSSNAFPLTIVQECNWNSGAAAGNSYTLTFPQTAAASGNTLFVMMATDGGQAFSTPAGWTVDLNTAQANNSRFVLIHKASAADTNVALTGTADLWAGYFLEVSGTHALDQSTIAGQAITATGQYVFSAITPTAGSLVFALIALTNGATFPQAQGTFNNVINPAWTTLYSSNSVLNGGRFLIGYVSSVAATNTSTKPPSIITYVSQLAASGAVVTTFSIL